jgi:hypothetical protein
VYFLVGIIPGLVGVSASPSHTATDGSDSYFASKWASEAILDKVSLEQSFQ